MENLNDTPKGQTEIVYFIDENIENLKSKIGQRRKLKKDNFAA